MSGAFHTQLMQPAIQVFEDAFEGITISRPRIPVYSNYQNRIYQGTKDVQKILIKQMLNSVKWESTINHMAKYKTDEHWPRFIECGPGTSLSAMMKQINGKIAKRTLSVPA